MGFDPRFAWGVDSITTTLLGVIVKAALQPLPGGKPPARMTPRPIIAPFALGMHSGPACSVCCGGSDFFGFDDFGFGFAGGFPGLHRGVLQVVLDIGCRGVVQRNVIADEAPDDGRIHGVGDAECPEQPRAGCAEALPAVAPDAADAVNVQTNRRVDCDRSGPPPAIHRQRGA